MNDVANPMDPTNGIDHPGSSSADSANLPSDIFGVRGRRVSRAEAIRITREIMQRAEERRVAALEAEAKLWSDL
jgi:hypothetical protein